MRGLAARDLWGLIGGAGILALGFACGGVPPGHDAATGGTTSDATTSTGGATSGTTATTATTTGHETTGAGSSTGAATMTTTLVPGVCGDAVVDPGEECDDGDTDDTDACTNTCMNAACGDGVIAAGIEGCDDGNVIARDGCSASCTPEQAPRIFLTSALAQFGFHGYHVELDLWVTLASPPNLTYSQLTNDGARVYLLGIDNTIHAYTPETDTWALTPIPGPGADLAALPVGYFKWTDQGFYYLKDSQTTLHHRKDDQWVSIALPNVGSCAGSWDRANHELFIRSHQQLGFMVVSTQDDLVVRSITDFSPVGEPSRTGSLSGAFFHDRAMFGPLQRFDANTGVKTSTGQFPASPHNASDTDLVTGSIYLAGYQNQSTVFQRYDPGPNTLVTLADSPSVPDLSTITVMLPPR